MTDEMFLAGFMEPEGSCEYRRKWWQPMLVGGRLHVNEPLEPRPITLNETREIESRLTDEQWWQYLSYLVRMANGPASRRLISADAATRISALANVLDPGRKARGEV